MKFAAVALALVAMIGVLVWTRAHGPGLSPDSASYLCAAEFMAQAEAPRVPFGDWDNLTSTPRLSHFPPGFSVLIALPVSLGVDAIQAARIVLVIAAGTNVLLTALLAGHVAGPLAAALAGCMVMLTPMLARNHAVVLSEPAFLVLVLLCLLLMLRCPGRVWSLGLVACAAAWVRYAGVALVGAAAVWMLWQPRPWASRLRNACCVVLPALLALGLWSRFTGHIRRYGYRPGVSQNLEQGWQTIVDWLVPTFAPSALRSALAVLVLAGVVLVVWPAAPTRGEAEQRDHAAFSRLRRACAVLGSAYVSVVFSSRLFADPSIPFDARLLSPLLLLMELLVSAGLALRWRSWLPTQRACAGVLVALWLTASGWALTNAAVGQYAEGWEYDSPSWQNSQLALWLRTEGARYDLYSDNPVALWLLAHRTSRYLPIVGNDSTLKAFSARLRQRPSAILSFAEPFTQTVPPSQLAARLQLSDVARLDRAIVWTSEASIDE